MREFVREIMRVFLREQNMFRFGTEQYLLSHPESHPEINPIEDRGSRIGDRGSRVADPEIPHPKTPFAGEVCIKTKRIFFHLG